MTPKKWARVRKAGAHGLRRGAWYGVVNDKKPTIAFLDVNKRNVAVDRTLLEFADVRPYRWSIVVRDPEDPGTRRASESKLWATYGVCPSCRMRANIPTDAERFACPQCSNDFAIDWENPC
ncbi:MAG TPA: hypothetical protein VGA37_04665 [Gemmatimonadales bacterium]